MKQIDATGVKIKMGDQRAGHPHQLDPSSSPEGHDMTVGEPLTWAPPLFTLDVGGERAIENDPTPDDNHTVRTTRSGRKIRPVDYYGY